MKSHRLYLTNDETEAQGLLEMCLLSSNKADVFTWLSHKLELAGIWGESLVEMVTGYCTEAPMDTRLSRVTSQVPAQVPDVAQNEQC